MDVLGQPMLILGTHDVAFDLLEKRSALYSDRVQSAMVDLCVITFLDIVSRSDAVLPPDPVLTGFWRRCPTVPGGDATDGPSTNTSIPTPSWGFGPYSATKSVTF